MPDECGFAFVDEGTHRLLVNRSSVRIGPCFPLPDPLNPGSPTSRRGQGCPSYGPARSTGPSARDFATAKSGPAKFGVGHDTVDETSISQRRASIRSDRKHQLPSPRRSTSRVSNPRNTVIPRQSDAGISRSHNRGFAGNADIAGERERKPAPPRLPKRCNRRLSHRHQRHPSGYAAWFRRSARALRTLFRLCWHCSPCL